jgi:hypothetical protein
VGPHTGRALEALVEYGLLLETDAALPSVAALVAGGPVRGSWWGHPQGHAIFAVARGLADHPDVLIARLVSGKLTYVHRRWWPELTSLGSARDPWQMVGLPSQARALLGRVDRQGQVEAAGPAARELEKRLLVHARDVHTASGAHARLLRSWKQVAGPHPAPAEARRRLENVVSRLNRRFGGPGRLPWLGTESRLS